MLCLRKVWTTFELEMIKFKLKLWNNWYWLQNNNIKIRLLISNAYFFGWNTILIFSWQYQSMSYSNVFIWRSLILNFWILKDIVSWKCLETKNILKFSDLFCAKLSHKEGIFWNEQIWTLWEGQGIWISSASSGTVPFSHLTFYQCSQHCWLILTVGKMIILGHTKWHQHMKR